MVLKSVDANCARFLDILQRMEGCLCFTDAGSDICIRSSLIVQNAAELGEAVHLIQCLALDFDGCVVGYDGLEHLGLRSVDGDAQST
ncbi:hypothetical protein DPMN_116923 [Dreissena polymorpha]|uniref:Uncharacterized protein n=1 Tax=Dreissena polymorpha TaxID=45954 RepID=A0A9D4QV66_DREPO|nr:hypothetical protein DPMN_116921 [Dreissena polymorpha]KAH3843407.1 hypothetical protein DPMN_116923 [Dreissena polymorpha]